MQRSSKRGRIKHRIVQHLHSVGAEKGYNSQMSFDFDAINIKLLKDFGYSTSITGRILNDLERTYLGFFIGGAKAGCFLMNEEDIDMFVDLVMNTNSGYNIVKMDKHHREDESFLGENHRYLYSNKLLLFMNRETVSMLSQAGRLMPNPFLFSMLPLLLAHRGKDDSFVTHIKSLEALMMMNLKLPR